MSFILVATMQTAASHLSDLIKAVNDLASASRKEQGCLAYTVLVSDEVKGKLVIFETWESEEHWQHHCETEHMLQFKSDPVKALTDISIERLRLN